MSSSSNTSARGTQADIGRVGAIQSRISFVSTSIQCTLQNQDAARSTLLDTDVTTPRAGSSTSQVQLQPGIGVRAEAHQRPQSLLKLIQ